jgi:thiamine biosynthesis lipoprotein
VTTPSIVRWRALGTTVVLGVDTSDAPDANASIELARRAVEAEIDAIDRACSRFREDSELMALGRAAGRTMTISSVFAQALDVALRAAELTAGLVDPTLGSSLRSLGYDRDFVSVPPDGPALHIELPNAEEPRADWRSVELDRVAGTVRVPAGVQLDLGATAKAWCADRAAGSAHLATGLGVLVNLGGDLAVAGPAPLGADGRGEGTGWGVRVTDDHAATDDAPGVDVTIESGGLATSSTTVRRWTRGGELIHHVVDPVTGRSAVTPWRTVSVAADSCVDANIAATTAVILGAAAPAWLAERSLPARLVASDGAVTVVGGWPGEAQLHEAQLDEAQLEGASCSR